MRTTVQLPDELLRDAKAEAAARGETLKDLFTRAVSHELGAVATTNRSRVGLPLVNSARPGTADITNAGIETVLAAEDAEKYGTL